MNIETKQKQFREEWAAIIACHICLVTVEMENERDVLIKYYAKCSRTEKQSFTIFDLQKGCIVSHQSTQKGKQHQLNILFHELTTDLFLMDKKHPKDALFGMELTIAAYKFLLSLPCKQQKDFQLIFQQRFNTKGTECQCRTHKIQHLIADATENPWLMLITTEPSTLTTVQVDEHYQIFGIKPEKQMKLFASLWKHDMVHLTVREMEVLQLIKQGLSKLEIAEKFKRSVSTVIKHSKNAKAKVFLNSANSAGNFVHQLQMGESSKL